MALTTNAPVARRVDDPPSVRVSTPLAVAMRWRSPRPSRAPRPGEVGKEVGAKSHECHIRQATNDAASTPPTSRPAGAVSRPASMRTASQIAIAGATWQNLCASIFEPPVRRVTFPRRLLRAPPPGRALADRMRTTIGAPGPAWRRQPDRIDASLQRHVMKLGAADLDVHGIGDPLRNGRQRSETMPRARRTPEPQRPFATRPPGRAHPVIRRCGENLDDGCVTRTADEQGPLASRHERCAGEYDGEEDYGDGDQPAAAPAGQPDE